MNSGDETTDPLDRADSSTTVAEQEAKAELKTTREEQAELKTTRAELRDGLHDKHESSRTTFLAITGQTKISETASLAVIRKIVGSGTASLVMAFRLAEGLHVTTVVQTGQARNSQVGAHTVLSSRAFAGFGTDSWT